jgi:hypothetical protein
LKLTKPQCVNFCPHWLHRCRRTPVIK